MEKCECYIHSLKQGETHVLGEATIIKRLGDNDYLAEYNGVKSRNIQSLCRTVFCGRCVRRYPQFARPGQQITERYGIRGRLQAAACPYYALKGGILF